ncbi:hypothetical protein GQ54DRAFT_202409 [Martensiomyces pterosporus]|nr:hypothetical protein GQ54DRAFT_202409 [Martensiomyces pterosporus]
MPGELLRLGGLQKGRASSAAHFNTAYKKRVCQTQWQRKGQKRGSTEIRTQVTGIRIRCDNQLHYRTIAQHSQTEPVALLIANENMHNPR